ncbi:MAG TPA: preprotein translocase subunit SecE [Clostridiales bacterium]|jgi:preprotein translocase subunit SecE|nr:preprotein translocase subunit SecE [Clostridiales bacterium]
MAEKKKGRIGRWFKEMGSELKKVIWAKPAAVLKQTGIVFAVVGFFILAVWLIDLGLSQVYQLLIRNLV